MGVSRLQAGMGQPLMRVLGEGTLEATEASTPFSDSLENGLG